MKKAVLANDKKGWGLTILFLLGLGLQGCSPAEKPLSQFEVSLRGTYSGALSIDGQQAVIGSVNHGGSFWAVQQQERLFDWNHKPGQFSELTTTALSSNGEFALTASVQELVLWNTQTGKPLTYFNAPDEILATSLSRSGKYALLGLANHTAVLMDVKKGGVLRTLNHQGRVRSVHLSADSHYALTGGDDNKARFWNIKTGQLLHSYQHQENVQLVKLSPDSKQALSVSKYDKVLLWSTQTGEPTAEVKISSEHLKRGKSFTAARFSQDGKLLLTGSSDREVTLWDTQTMNQLKRWRVNKRKWMKPTAATVLDLAFSNEQTIQVIGSNGLLYALAY